MVEISGYGMLLGMEVVKDPETKAPFPFGAMVALQETALAKGLYIRLSGGAPRYMVAPPLDLHQGRDRPDDGHSFRRPAGA